MRYHLIDAGRFSDADLAAREGLPALWFRLEAAADTGAAVAVADDVLAWLARHPEFAPARALFAALLGAMVAPLGPGVRVPEDLLEVRNMLATRAETWIRNWLEQGLEQGRQEGRNEGRQEGEAALLLRQMERRFGALPVWLTDQVLAADSATLEEWGLRILDAVRLEDVIGELPSRPT